MSAPQHVMVTTTNVWGDLEAAGVLLEWQIRDGQWWALVVWAESHSGGWTISERWVEAEKVRAVGPDGKDA
jgi:hypothetical protein